MQAATRSIHDFVRKADAEDRRRLCALAAVSWTAQAQTLKTYPSMPLSTFQDSLGINIHIEYTNGK